MLGAKRVCSKSTSAGMVRDAVAMVPDSVGRDPKRALSDGNKLVGDPKEAKRPTRLELAPADIVACGCGGSVQSASILRLIHGRYVTMAANYPGGEENLGIEHEGRTEKHAWKEEAVASMRTVNWRDCSGGSGQMSDGRRARQAERQR